MSNFKNIVYYTGFWYSTHSIIRLTDFDGFGYSKKMLDQIKCDMRLLSLIFDIIHVPRSHFLTFQNTLHHEVVKEYLLTSDFQYFNEQKILLSSLLPSTDRDSDTERIIERVKSNHWSSDIDNDFIRKVRSLDFVNIDSKRESAQNVDIFQQYISLLKVKHKKVAHILDEIKKRSHYQQIPFLHELFIEEIAKSPKINELAKKKIWEVTNSYYISTGGLDLGEDRRISLNVSAEDPRNTHDNSGLQRSLYSPRFIQSLIAEELGDKYMIKYLTAHINDIMRFRNLPSWRSFLDDLFEMINTISLLERYKPEKFSRFSDQEKIQAYKKYLEDGIAEEISHALKGGSIRDAQKAELNTPGGAENELAAKQLIKSYTENNVSQKMESYKVFWKEFKSELNKIS